MGSWGRNLVVRLLLNDKDTQPSGPPETESLEGRPQHRGDFRPDPSQASVRHSALTPDLWSQGKRYPVEAPSGTDRSLPVLPAGSQTPHCKMVKTVLSKPGMCELPSPEVLPLVCYPSTPVTL